MVSSTSAILFHPQMQQRALLACVVASIALHAMALLSFPGLRPYAPASPKMLTATLMPVPALAPAQASEPPTITEPPRPRPKPRPAMRPEPRSPEVARPALPEPPAAPEQTASAASAPEASAVASSAAPSVAVTPAPAAVVDPLDPALLQKYKVGLASFAQQYKRYPAQAIERGWEGRVEIRITVRPTGTIESARIKTPSGHQILDDQALDMVRRALARTPVPPSLLGREFSIDIPVVFELQSG